jgi:SRSO17 transposase
VAGRRARAHRLWLSNLPADTPLRELVGLAKIHWRIEHDCRELKDGLSLDHFEGCSNHGWHRHVTLTALARSSAPACATTQKILMPPLAVAPAGG